MRLSYSSHWADRLTSVVNGIGKALDEVTEEDQELMTTDEYQVRMFINSFGTGLIQSRDTTKQ